MALGMLFGIAAGIGAGILLAPRSGAETRQKLKDQARDARERTKAQLAVQRSKASERLSRAMEKSKDMVDKAAADNTSAHAAG